MKNSDPPDQTDLFASGEGDAWYRRNKESLTGRQRAHEVELLEQVLEPFKPSIGSILEIGCSSGEKLERLAQVFSASAHGIDPSAMAIEAGRRRLRASNNAKVDLSVGTADQLPYADGQFDLVHFGFCLYVVARERLTASLAEADRVLKSGGFLSILDFDPAQSHNRPYHHKAGVYSYKHRYDEFFTAAGAYHLVFKSSFSHRQPTFDKDPDERIALTVLYKEAEIAKA